MHLTCNKENARSIRVTGTTLLPLGGSEFYTLAVLGPIPSGRTLDTWQ